MVVTLQPFLYISLTFYRNTTKKHIKKTFYLNITETITLLEDTSRFILQSLGLRLPMYIYMPL